MLFVEWYGNGDSRGKNRRIHPLDLSNSYVVVDREPHQLRITIHSSFSTQSNRFEDLDRLFRSSSEVAVVKLNSPRRRLLTADVWYGTR